MRILVVNGGSSSLKAEVVDTRSGARIARVRVERIGHDNAAMRLDDGDAQPVQAPDHVLALRAALPHLRAAGPVAGVGHRVVHGGPDFSAPAVIDADVEAAIEALTPLAPLHNPANLAGIRAARQALPDVPHVAVFDTAFHATLPARARAYALPQDLADKHGLRRYGFHGPSHQFVAQRAAAFLHADPRDLRLITCHLGNGASVAAVEYGRSVETSMGMTPLEGLVMGTRSGDVDPGVLLHLMREEGLDTDGLDDLLNKRSGLAGLSGTSGDLRDIEARAADGDKPAQRAIQVFAHRLRKYLGAYAAVMGGVDAIVFTGGIGEHSALMRHRVAQRLGWMGARLDEDANREAQVSHAQPVVPIHDTSSRVHLLVVATDEALSIAGSAAHVVGGLQQVAAPRTIPIAVSARHIHLTDEAVEALFGPGHTLTPRNPLSQPGQFACEEVLDVVGPKRTIEGVRVLGPTRPKNQVEVSRTDEFFLGLDAPVRMSGDTANTPGITLRGPAGSLTIPDGVICAWRHIHMTPADAEAFGVKHKDTVEVEIVAGPRRLTFNDVVVRVKDSYALEMHIDTDEANAAELSRSSEGMLVATTGEATLRKRSARFDPTDA